MISVSPTDDKSTSVQVMANVDPDLCHHVALLGHSGLNALWISNIYLLKWTGYFSSKEPTLFFLRSKTVCELLLFYF